MFCIQCGQQLSEDTKFCHVCGAEIVAEESPQAEPQNITEVAPAAIPTPVEVSPAIPVPDAVPIQAQEPQTVYPQHVPATHHALLEEEGTGGMNKKTIIIVSAIVLLAVISAVVAFFLSRGQGLGNEHTPAPRSTYEAQPTGPNIENEVSLYHINRVVNGYLANYPGTSVGTAFGQFFTDYTWSHFTDNNINYVDFVGTMLLEDATTVRMQIWFRFTADDQSFNASNLFRGGFYQDAATLRGLLDTVFASVE
ncbi:MAG: zinc-ribbon domain-containing protein [Defluviitaleaceae bacterium]|nr:zinc-ribbon domain-containing protein [Defluviitaleaceae bacterium]